MVVSSASSLELRMQFLIEDREDAVKALKSAEKLTEKLKRKKCGRMSDCERQQQLKLIFDSMHAVKGDLRRAEEQLSKCRELSINVKEQLIASQQETLRCKLLNFFSGFVGILAPAVVGSAMSSASSNAATAAAAAEMLILTLTILTAGRTVADNEYFSDTQLLLAQLLRSHERRLSLLEEASDELEQLRERRERILELAEQMRK